jgi:DNA-binding transcriptional MerR regulator
MLEIAKSNNEFPSIPGKRYFTISEMGELCSIKPHILRYWEQEFTTLKPIKRRGNRRYYQQQDVVLVRQIRSLLYDNGFTIDGAKQKLLETNSFNNKQVNNELISKLRSELEELLNILN